MGLEQEELTVAELKAVKALEDVHFAVVRSYLRATGREHGLILNFAKPTLEIKRVIASHGPTMTSWLPDFLASLEAPFSVKHPESRPASPAAFQRGYGNPPRSS